MLPLACFDFLKPSTRTKISDIKAYYTNAPAPNPMLVDFFAKEKGIDLKVCAVEVDLPGMANRNAEHLKRNPAGQLPYFELVDGTVIAETIAMCEFLEEAKPQPALIGSSAKARGTTRMWQRRMEEHFVYPCFYGFRFATASPDFPEKTGGGPAVFKDFFANRNNKETGAVLIPGAYREMRQWALNKLSWLESLKKGTSDEWIAGDEFTMVDIQVWTTIKFFGMAGEPYLAELEMLPWLKAWYERVEKRPACQAMLKDSAGFLW